MLFFAVKARERMNKAFEESRKKVAEINAEIESSVSGVRITKAVSYTHLDVYKRQMQAFPRVSDAGDELVFDKGMDILLTFDR